MSVYIVSTSYGKTKNVHSRTTLKHDNTKSEFRKACDQSNINRIGTLKDL